MEIRGLDALPVWDHDGALARVRGKPERLVRLVSRFIQDIGNDMNEYRNAVEKQDFPTAQRCAHTIKGVAAHLGAEKLKSIALEAEAAGSKADLEGLSFYTTALQQALDELIPQFEVFLSEHS